MDAGWWWLIMQTMRAFFLQKGLTIQNRRPAMVAALAAAQSPLGNDFLTTCRRASMDLCW